MKRIRNNLNEELILVKRLDALEVLSLNKEDEVFWSESSEVISKISDGSISVGDSSTFFTDINEQINFLKDKVKPEINTVNYPFAAKKTESGKKLFTRIHGINGVLDTSTKNLILIVPYAACKITGIEIIGGSLGDKCNFKVLDSSTGLLTTIPSFMLNQFGFDVCISKDFYRFNSSYDADLYGTMQLLIEYTPKNVNSQEVYINFILHELKD